MRQAEPGRPPAAPRRSCCVPGLRAPPPLPRLPQNFYSLGPPGCLKDSESSARSALPCGGDQGDVHLSPAGL